MKMHAPADPYIKTKYKKFLWLDWLRFIAAFVVVLGHIRENTFVKYEDLPLHNQNIFTALFYPLTMLGNASVLMFFVLSGFLVGGISLERLRNDNFNIISYSIDRIARIMPPLIGALILTVIVSYYIGNPLHIGQLLTDRSALIVGDTVVSRFPQNQALWSLIYEIWFYILIFALCLVKDGKALGLITFIVIACVFNILSTNYLFCWLIGAAAFFKLPEKPSFKILTASIIVMAYGALSQIKDFSLIENVLPEQFFLATNYSRIIFSFGAAIFLRHLIVLKPRFSFVIKFEALGGSLASFSYSLYLTHSPIIKLFEHWGFYHFQEISLKTGGIYCLQVITCFAVAILLYQLIEKHTVWVRNKLQSLADMFFMAENNKYAVNRI